MAGYRPGIRPHAPPSKPSWPRRNMALKSWWSRRGDASGRTGLGPISDNRGPGAPASGPLTAIVAIFWNFPGNLSGPAASNASRTIYWIEPNHHAPDPGPTRDNVEKKIGPVMMDAFPVAGRPSERL